MLRKKSINMVKQRLAELSRCIFRFIQVSHESVELVVRPNDGFEIHLSVSILAQPVDEGVDVAHQGGIEDSIDKEDHCC
jgi:hypothetical protein